MKKRIFALALAVVLLLSMSMVVYAADPVSINVEANGAVQPQFSIVYTANTVVMEPDDSIDVNVPSGMTRWTGTYHVGIVVTQGEYDDSQYVSVVPDATFTMSPVSGSGASVIASTEQSKTKWCENPGSAEDSTAFIRSFDTVEGQDGKTHISVSTANMEAGTVTVNLPSDATAKYTGSFYLTYGLH